MDLEGEFVVAGIKIKVKVLLFKLELRIYDLAYSFEILIELLLNIHIIARDLVYKSLYPC